MLHERLGFGSQQRASVRSYKSIGPNWTYFTLRTDRIIRRHIRLPYVTYHRPANNLSDAHMCLGTGAPSLHYLPPQLEGGVAAFFPAPFQVWLEGSSISSGAGGDTREDLGLYVAPDGSATHLECCADSHHAHNVEEYSSRTFS
jgi:hypothetical protein